MAHTPQESGRQRCPFCELVRHSLSWLYRLVEKIYVIFFARPSAQRLNNKILTLAIRARGYDNFGDFKETGEQIFIKILAARDPKLCLDVGANKGQYARVLLEKTGAKVISFEPLPRAFAALLTLKDEFGDRFEAENVGVGEREDTLALHYGREDSKLASFSEEVGQVDYVHNVNTMNVEVISLDRYFEKHSNDDLQEIDLLKIDTEGFEYQVLRGAQKTIAVRRPKFIQIEFNWHQLFRAQSLLSLSELMAGYRAFQLLPHGSGLVHREVKSPESNIYRYSNFVFVRNDIHIP
jgi:FkbM family methyltransferase